MNAFNQAIERIDEIKVDDALRASLVDVFEKWAKYIDEHPNVKIDFDKLFKNNLYNNLTIKLEDKVIVDGSEVGGAYYCGKNEIRVSNLPNMLSHILMHEFTHFVYHNTYKNLPLWADEMLTEAFTIDRYNINYGSYIKLIYLFEVLDKNLEKIDFEQFLNGEFDAYIKQNNLDDINSQLLSLIDKTTQDQYNDIMTTIVLGKCSNLLSQGLTFKDYLENMLETDLRGLNFDGKLYVDRLAYSAIQYVNKVQYVGTDFMQVRSYIEKMCIINRLQKEFDEKIENIQTGKIKGVPFILGVGEKQVIFWYDFPSFRNTSITKGQYAKIEVCDNSFSSCQSASIDGKTIIEVMGQKFVLNEKEKLFTCEQNSAVELEKISGTMQENIQELADVFNLAIYKDDKQKFVTKSEYERERVFSGNKEFDSKMHDLTRLTTAIGAPIYACKQSLYKVGKDENWAIFTAPFYSKHDETTLSTKIGKITKENIITVLKEQNVQFGEQFDIVAKVGDKYVTIANVCKGHAQNNEDFGISVNYRVALNQLAPEHADAVLSEFVPIEKSNLIKIDECFEKKKETIKE